MKKIVLFACLALSLAASDPAALPLLSPVFGEHMVLQRGKPTRLWGWAKPGAEVRINLAGHEAIATAGIDGRWDAQVEPPSAGGPYKLTIDGPQRLEFGDILVGDVWLCGGQSNMEFDLARSRDGAAAVRQSTHEAIRLFRVASQPAYAPAAVLHGEWRRCAPAAFAQNGGFSAVAYYFGRKVQAETGVPIGLIEVAIGGTPAESWMSPAALQAFPDFAAGLAEMNRLRERGAPAYGNYIMHWYDEFDRGVAGKWSESSLDDTAWPTAALHDAFTRLGVPTTPRWYGCGAR